MYAESRQREYISYGEYFCFDLDVPKTSSIAISIQTELKGMVA
jgi:hypothetical protein